MQKQDPPNPVNYTAPIPPPKISSGCCTAGVCGQCEWESKRGPVGQKRWFLCKAELGGLCCRSVFNGIRFSTKSRWQSKIFKSSRCRGCIGPLMTCRDNGGRCMGSSNAYKGRMLGQLTETADSFVEGSPRNDGIVQRTRRSPGTIA